MESFINPADLTRTSYQPSPVPPRMADAIAHSLSASYSPVVGGKTAKAEFEVLCGVPDFDLLGTVTFNQMGDSPIDCLPRLLGHAGYRTLASTPLPGSFFNIKHAYKSIGFDERLLKESFAFDDMDGSYLTNSSTLRQNVDVVKQRIAAAPEQPLLNYLVLLGGHFPFERDEKRRPSSIEVTPANAVVSKLVNMSHYTLLALQDYLELDRGTEARLPRRAVRRPSAARVGQDPGRGRLSRLRGRPTDHGTANLPAGSAQWQGGAPGQRRAV